MMVNRYTLYGICFMLFAVYLCACDTDRQNVPTDINTKEYKEPLIEANKLRVQREDAEIDNYIKRHQWDMKETGTGLRYLIYYEDDTSDSLSMAGEEATTGKTAVINFKISLLDGTACYSSKNDGIRTFTIGQGGVESGLEEGVLLLKVGDKAKFILPSHLAYGLLGDGDKIPSHAAIIYDVELINLK